MASDQSLNFGLQGSNLFTDNSLHTAPSGYFWYQITNTTNSVVSPTLVGNIQLGDGLPNANNSNTVDIQPGQSINGYFISVTNGSGLLCYLSRLL